MFSKAMAKFILSLFLACGTMAASNTVPEISNLANTIAESLVINNKKIVAVADFTDLEGNVNVLGRFIAEEFSITLASQRKDITVIDRNQLKKMLGEKNITVTGVIDPGFAKQIGNLTGAEVILTGSTYPASNGIYVSVKMIDVNSARIFGGTSITIARNQIIDDLIKVSFKIPELTPQTQKQVFSPQVKETYDFIFILNQVVMDGNTMILNLEIKNNFNEARYLTVDSIKGIDDTGRVYYPSNFIAGPIKASISDTGKIQSSSGEPSDNFDVPFREYQQVKAQITLKNISQKAKSLGILEITVAPVNIVNRLGTFLRQEAELSTIQFTNIPVSREKNGPNN
ncbi:MAG: FlgO family outer membrane protein [bacterium]|nr:FlgO family outer membrane protein [bacterium]